MKVFVTGASGFIGQYVIIELLSLGYQVIALTRGKEITKRKNLQVVKGDLSGDLSGYYSGVDIFIHLASFGVKPEEQNDWNKCFEINVIQSMMQIKQAISKGVNNYIVCGSCFEYGRVAERYEYIPSDAELRPTGAYHSSKAAATMMMHGLTTEYNLKTNIIRPFHIYGDGECENRFWPSLVKAARAGKDFDMSEGKQVRDFTDVKYAAKYIAELVDKLDNIEPGNAKITHIGYGKPKSLRQFAEEEWANHSIGGRLNFSKVKMRRNEVMRFVPEI